MVKKMFNEIRLCNLMTHMFLKGMSNRLNIHGEV